MFPLLILSLLCGCLKSPADSGGVGVQGLLDQSAANPVVQIVEPIQPIPDPAFTEAAPAVAEPTPVPAVEYPPTEPTAEPVGYTGIRVFGDPATCNPCRNLYSDLRFLRDSHGWTVSESEDIPAQWQFLPPRETDRRLPLIEVWSRGVLVESFSGYSCESDPQLRQPCLIALIAHHPNGRQRASE